MPERRPANIWIRREHAAILIMSSTAAHSARAIEVIAIQRLWYEKTPSTVVCIFLVFTSQILGYGVAGMMRKILVYPTKASTTCIFLFWFRFLFVVSCCCCCF